VSDWINQWSISGTITAVVTLIVAWLRRNADPTPGNPLRKPLRWLSQSGRRMVAEDALEFTTQFNSTLLAQRNRGLEEITRLDLALADAEAQNAKLEAEIARLRSQIRGRSTGSNGGYIG
jgi:hypothetical protein